MSRVPQVIITLSPDGALQAELPYSGGRRRVTIESLDSIRQILAAQLRQTPSTIGMDGSPTGGQVRHWERHENEGIIDPDCPWCIAKSLGIDTSREAYAAARRALYAAREASRTPISKRPASHQVGDGSVRVTIIPTKSRKISSRKLDFSTLFDDDDPTSTPEATEVSKPKKSKADFSSLFS
jgi:hypothetical protein